MNGYLSFTILCFCYGTSYAVTSLFIGSVNDAAFSLLRAFAAAIAATVYLFSKLKNPEYKQTATHSLSSGETNFFKSFFSGILFLGLPTTFTIIAQKAVPSFIVIIAQPTIPFFSMLAAHIMTSDEKITFNNFIVQITAILGAVLTLVPSLDLSAEGESSLFSYVLLLIAIIMYGIGAIYIKVFLATAEVTLSCVFAIYGSLLYSLFSALYRFGISNIIAGFLEMSPKVVLLTFIMGVVYNCVPTFLFMDCIRELGAVKAQLTNFGQIIIGVFVGVLFLNEWADFTTKDICYVLSGLVLIVAAMISDLGGQVSQQITNKCLKNQIDTIVPLIIGMIISFISQAKFVVWSRPSFGPESRWE